VGDDAVGDVVSASPQDAFLAVRRAIEALAAERPVVLVLEDLHWAEPLVLDLVEHLVEWTQNGPVLLLALARPELRELRPALVETASRAALVTVLEGLDATDSERLACDLLETDELPPALVGRILAGSEGNPLFVREVVRMLVDDGVLRRQGEQWRPTIEVDAISVPPTIQSLLAARVERLPADERTVLEVAAVVGREFFRGAVAELVSAPIRRDLDVVLERLRQKEMVEPEGTYWIDEPVLRFHHVLLRDAAYRRLLKEVRAELHERYAQWLDAKAGQVAENDEMLGYHLEQAHQYRVELGLFDDHTTLLGHRAAERLAAAGRRALDRDDLPAAAGLLGRALARMDGDDPDRASLLIDRCEALLSTGSLADGSLALAELEGLAAGSPRLRAWASCFSAQLAVLTDPGQLQETAAIVERAAVELAKLADAAGAAKAHAVHASALARLGRVAETEAALDRALAAAREAGDTRRATAVLAGAPLAALWGPSPVARASGRCLDVVRVLRITTSATTVEATSLRCQAVLEALRGRTDAARRMLASARRSLEELGHRHGLLSTEMFAGLVELLADEPTAAEKALQRAHEGFLELGAGADAGQAAALRARAVMAQGRTAEAEQLTIDSERLGGADLKTAIAWRAVRAEALARRGAIDDALALARAAVALAEPTDALLDQADTHVAMATILQLAGRTDEAGASVARAADLYERKGATVPAQRAHALLSAPIAAPPQDVQDAGERRWVSANAGSRILDELLAFVLAGEWDRLAARTAPSFEQVDHRSVSAGRLDAAGWHESLRQIIRLGVTAIDHDVIATRGDRLQLGRIVFSGQTRDGDRGEVVILSVTEFDAQDRVLSAHDFDPEDLVAALHELDARSSRVETAVGRSWAAARAFIDNLNARAWDDMRA
jgi:tetratricopeptide (TPR) repeat protein